MGSNADRIAEDMVGVMGNADAEAELMYQTFVFGKVNDQIKAKQYQAAIDDAGKFIRQVGEYQTENPGVSQYFDFRLAQLYKLRAFAYALLGIQNNDTSMKKLALTDAESALRTPNLPDETRDACELLKRDMTAEIAEAEKKKGWFKNWLTH